MVIAESVAEVNEPVQANIGKPIALPEIRKEIVCSSAVSRRHFLGPRLGRPVRSGPELTARDRLKLLCGQLRLLRLRAQAGLPVSPAAIARAERLASSLEAA